MAKTRHVYTKDASEATDGAPGVRRKGPMRPRIDGVGRLSQKEKDERDARAQRWMNQRKIERVAEAAERTGWFSFAGEDFRQYAVAVDLTVFEIDGTFFYVHDYDEDTDTYTLRRTYDPRPAQPESTVEVEE